MVSPVPKCEGPGAPSFIKSRAEISESFLFELVDYVEDVIADDDQRHDPG
jgi:hypothetical protein